MAPATFSYAQSLRVIGQALQALHIEVFRLEKNDDEYIVRLGRGRSAGKLLWEATFVKSIAEKLLGPSDLVRYDSSDIDRLETKGRLGRGCLNSVPDAENLSLALRALGDYLDQKRARDFLISWSEHSVRVKYVTVRQDLKEEDFTLENLYDRGVHMYLRRSNRQSASG